MDELNRIIVELIDVQDLDWSSVYSIIQADYPELSRPAIRGRYYRHSDKHQSQAPSISGVLAGEGGSRVDDAIQRARDEWEEQRLLRERRMRQSVEFERGPICLVFMADIHAGSAGVNYDRLFEEAETVASVPGMYVAILGDLVDQFVLGNLRNIRFHSRMSISDEWAIARGFLDLIAHKIVVSVSGNHENWANTLIGVDYFRDVLARVREDVLYDMHESAFSMKVGGAMWKVKLRHKWRGTSRTNPTHGIETAALFDQDFDVGVGAHTHVSGLSRYFNNAGKTGLSILCGSYKYEDEYATSIGLPDANGVTAVPVVFTERGTMMTFSDLDDAAEYMRVLGRRKWREVTAGEQIFK